MTQHSPPGGLVLTGPPGTGKTSTMWALHTLLTERKVPSAVIDVDYVRNAWPAPPDDSFNARLGRRNVGAMAETYREHGMRWLVLADIIESSADVEAYAAVLASWTTEIAWYLERSAVLQEIMEREHVGDIVIDVTGESARAVAERILDAVAVVGGGARSEILPVGQDDGTLGLDDIRW